MAKTITVNVTAENIAEGCRHDGYACPVNHALRPLFPKLSGYYDLYVDGRIIVFGDTDDSKGVTPPREVSDFIDRFDAGRDAVATFTPFSFELESPEGLQNDPV